MDDPTGQILLVRTEGFWPWVIRTVTNSEYNHSLNAISPTHGIEAAGAPNLWAWLTHKTPGVRIVPLTLYPDAVYSQFDLSPQQQAAITGWLREQLHKPYAYWDDITIGLGLILKTRTPRWLQRELSDGDQWQCAALTDAALQQAGIHMFKDHRPTGAVYPGSIEKYYRAQGWL